MSQFSMKAGAVRRAEPALCAPRLAPECRDGLSPGRVRNRGCDSRGAVGAYECLGPSAVQRPYTWPETARMQQRQEQSDEKGRAPSYSMCACTEMATSLLMSVMAWDIA